MEERTLIYEIKNELFILLSHKTVHKKSIMLKNNLKIF